MTDETTIPTPQKVKFYQKGTFTVGAKFLGLTPKQRAELKAMVERLIEKEKERSDDSV